MLYVLRFPLLSYIPFITSNVQNDKHLHTHTLIFHALHVTYSTLLNVSPCPLFLIEETLYARYRPNRVTLHGWCGLTPLYFMKICERVSIVYVIQRPTRFVNDSRENLSSTAER